jgi:hypothetical protein
MGIRCFILRQQGERPMPDPRLDLDDERLEWYMMTPLQRLAEYEKMFQFYLEMGGSLDPDHDSQSPFDPFYEGCRIPADGRPGVRVVRGGGV